MIFLKKFKINPPDIVHVPNNFIWSKPQAMPFELISSVDVSDYVIDGSLSIDFRVELDDPLNFISTSGSVDITEPSDPEILSYLDIDGLMEDILLVDILDEETGIEQFLGIVNPQNSDFDNVERTYHLYFYDIFSYVYNHLSNYLATIEVDGQVMGDLFPYYQELSMGDQYIPLDFFLRTYNSIGDGATTDVDISFTVERLRVLATQLGAITINNFMDQVRNHYGAYAFIDGYGVLRLISRNRGLLNEGSEDITEDIIEESYFTDYTLPAEYNAVLCSSILPDEEGDLFINHLIYYDGELKYKIIKTEDDLSSFNYLDLRTQIPGGISALYLFPVRTIDDLKEIYGDIVKPQNIVKCQINRIDLPILKRVKINDDEYIIMNMTKDYTERYSSLELLRK